MSVEAEVTSISEASAGAEEAATNSKAGVRASCLQRAYSSSCVSLNMYLSAALIGLIVYICDVLDAYISAQLPSIYVEM